MMLVVHSVWETSVRTRPRKRNQHPHTNGEEMILSSDAADLRNPSDLSERARMESCRL